MPVPISLIIDDGAPLVHVYRCHKEDVHHDEPLTADGRRLPDFIPNAFLGRYCDVCERHGLAGNFSIVPAPGGWGDVVRGIPGHDLSLVREWLETVKTRLQPRFDLCSEGITHNLARNLEHEYAYFPQSEHDWSQTQTRETLTPYLTYQLQLLKDAGIDANGVTSPWAFGIDVEEEYVASIVAAQKDVYGRDFSWYFLHMLDKEPERRPWVAYRDGDTVLVSIPANVDDYLWQTIDSPRADAEYVQGIADRYLSADGSSGTLREILDAGHWPILVTHWQSLFSAGLETGLAVLDEVGARINRHLGDEVRWTSSMEMARMVADAEGSDVQPSSFRTPQSGPRL